MQDLGLLDDFDPKTGARRQEQLTRDEMLEEINKRRAERLESRGVYRGDIPPPIGDGETVNPRFVGGKKIIEKSPPPQFESPEPVTGPQSKQRTTMTSYNIYQQDIGDPDTYEEITYGLRKVQKEREPLDVPESFQIVQLLDFIPDQKMKWVFISQKGINYSISV